MSIEELRKYFEELHKQYVELEITAKNSSDVADGNFRLVKIYHRNNFTWIKVDQRETK